MQAFREVLSRGVLAPLNLVMLTRERIQETMDDAVKRGRMTRDDANEMVTHLLQRGRKQTDDVLGDLERLLTRTRGRVEQRTDRARGRAAAAADRARKQVDQATREARRRVRGSAEPALAQADRVRRVAGVGSNFPITGYDALKVDQVKKRLVGLTAAELRKVRDYEKRNRGRASVLKEVERKLG